MVVDERAKQYKFVEPLIDALENGEVCIAIYLNQKFVTDRNHSSDARSKHF